MQSIKFLADVNIERLIIDYLIKNKYNIKYVPDYKSDMLDEELIDLANKEKRVVLTNDKDFGDLIFLQNKISAGIILFRIKNQNAEIKLKLLKKVMKNYSDKIHNHFVVITNEKIRFVKMGEIK